MAYSKLHSSIVNSSLWCEADNVRLLFITLLALCDKDGYVYGSRSGIERAANIAMPCEGPDIRNPWHVLMSPDLDSSDKMRAPENEGRRVEEVPGGFKLLNFSYYRGLRNEDDRREQNRVAQEKYRISHGKPPSAEISRDKPPSAHTETEADTDSKAKKRRVKSSSSAGFDSVWAEYPKRVGKVAAERHFNASVKSEDDLANLRLALRHYKASRRVLDGFVQDGSRWFLNWRDWVEDSPERASAFDTTNSDPRPLCANCGHGDEFHCDYTGQCEIVRDRSNQTDCECRSFERGKTSGYVIRISVMEILFDDSQLMLFDDMYDQAGTAEEEL